MQWDSNPQPAWQIGYVYIYELGGCGFESCCNHFKFQISRLCWARSSLTLRPLQYLDLIKHVYDMIKRQLE